jgi:hypothetical protein
VKRFAQMMMVAGSVLVGSLSAQGPGLQDPLLDRMIGEWVMQGQIAGDQVTHDITFEWILQHNYVRMTERSRELEPDGRPSYEAMVIIGEDPHSDGYAAMWLDITGTGGLTGDGLGHATAVGDSIPFLFHFPDGSRWHTIFVYRRATDQWTWVMHGEGKAESDPFAKVTLTRK